MAHPYLLAETFSGYRRADIEARAQKNAMQSFEQIFFKGWLRQVWSTLTGKSNRLSSLAEITATRTDANRYYLGRRTVSLDQIQGSSNRVDDFDNHFFPLRSHLKQRWARVAVAYELGLMLPPVKLTQVGEVYYIEDGHHRVSVAKARGQLEIEAEVDIWQCKSK
jgi:hypothetical protein